MKSVMKHQFSQVPQADIPRSSFNRSRGYKTAFDSGYLIPVFVDEALPSDTFNVNMTMFARLATPLVPIMDNAWIESFFFAVPIRLLWSNFQKFMGEQDNPGDSTSYIMPTIASPASTGWVVGSLSDYLGLPTGITNLTANAMWHRAYNRIYKDWFRDENLQNSPTIRTGDSGDVEADYPLRRIGKKRDYFTSCLPWAQKGTAVSIGMSGTAPVLGLGKYTTVYGGTNTTVYESDGTTSVYAKSASIDDSDNDKNLWVEQNPSKPNYPNIRADLSSVTATTINNLREAFQLQRLMERDARGGSRYTEIVKAHFGATSPDARMQRPEYLGGGKSPLVISTVAQTANEGDTPLGHLAAFGTIATNNRHGFTKSFTEHCVIIGLVAIRSDLTYQQGIDRMFSRSTKYDYYWPALAHLGEQSVLTKEIYAQGTADDATVFGYQERFAEYRYANSKITGKLRSTYSTPLDVWHLSQKFTSKPTLGDTFIQENAPFSRVLAVTDEPQFIFDSYASVNCVRPMPVYSVPGLIDHF